MKAGQWSMALRNLARNKRRNLATGVAIALGFAALLALSGYVHRVQNYLRVYTIYATRVGHITIYKEGGLERFSIKPKAYSLDEGEQAKIRDIVAGMKNVELHGPQLQGAGLVGNGCRTLPFLASGINPELDLELRGHREMKNWAPNIRDYTKGRGIWNYPSELGAIAISAGLARMLHKTKVHDDFPADQKATMVTDCLAPNAKDLIASDANVQLAAGSWSGMMSALDGEVVAEFNTGIAETNNSTILTSLEHMQKLYDTKNVTFYSIWLKDANHLDQALSDVRAKLRDAGLKVDVYPWTDEAVAPFYTGTMQFLYTMVGFITVVLATVIIFSVFNAATMTVIERAQEIGMMRSLGFNRRHIRQLFVMEMLILSAMAVLIGGIFGGLGIFTVNHARIRFNPPGVAGGMNLMLVTNALNVIGAALLIFALSVLTTLAAVRSVVRRKIPALLMGSQR